MLIYLRAVGLLYRTMLPFTLLISGLILGSALLVGKWPPQLFYLLLLKLSTFPVVIYLSAQFRPHQNWLFQNLHLTPRQLWAGIVVADSLLFLLLLRLAVFFFPAA